MPEDLYFNLICVETNFISLDRRTQSDDEIKWDVYLKANEMLIYDVENQKTSQLTKTKVRLGRNNDSVRKNINFRDYS